MIKDVRLDRLPRAGERHGLPPPLDELGSAVEIAAIAVPIIEFVLLRFHQAMDFVLVHAREIVDLVA